MNRRRFLKTTGGLAGAILGANTEFGSGHPALQAGTRPQRAVMPFRLDQVSLGDGIFREKRDRMLNYARNYGGATNIFAGPDRMLANFRATAGLDTKNAQPPGSWDNATGYLRGHYSGHFMSLLAQAFASTGDDTYKRKLDYMVAALGECQDALATAAGKPTPRVPGRFGTALQLTGSPLGHAEHVRLPEGIVNGLSDFTIALWIKRSAYNRANLSDANADPATLDTGAAIFDFGSPNPEFGIAPLIQMYLTIRASNNNPAPRFRITTKGANTEQRIEGTAPIPAGEWTHVAITRAGNTGTLYVNGVAAGVNTNMTLRPADLGTTTGNWIGRRQFPQANVSYLNAAIDEFQIFSRALTTAQIQSLTAAAGATSGDVACYRFDEAGGREILDSSGRRQHAVVLGLTDGRRHPGFLSAYPETPFVRLEEFAAYGGNQGIWAPYYTLHKIMAGLLDAHLLAGNTQALDIAAKIGDWVHNRLAPLRQEQLNRMWNTYIAGEYGGMNESLAQLHALRPKPEYLAAAKRFDNTVVYDAMIRNDDILDGRHANQHIPQFTGYLRIFEESGDTGYHTAARNFWNMAVPHRVYSHGGMGVGEILRKRDAIAASLYQLPNDANSAETCVVYNMLKLSRNLFFHDPDPRYMHYYEQGLHNQILASRRDIDSADNPQVTYFIPARPGQLRSYGNIGTCCGGTGMENHTKYQDSIYFRSSDGSVLYVNLYINSTLRWPERGFAAIIQTTQFPINGSSRLTLNGMGPLEIRFRIPSWMSANAFTLRINGATQDIAVMPGTYTSIRREWQHGDTIDIAMPFRFRVEHAIDNPAVQSIFYGPTLLALQAPAVGNNLDTGLIGLSLYKQLKLDGDLGRAMTPATRTLHFTVQGQTFAPFYIADPQAGATTPYHLYFRRQEPMIAFGAVDTGIANVSRADGKSFLDVLWDDAPFATHAQFLSAVERVSATWRNLGLLREGDVRDIREAAVKAEPDLRI